MVELAKLEVKVVQVVVTVVSFASLWLWARWKQV